MLGMGNPLALHDNFTVEPLRTVKLLLGCNEEITGGTGTQNTFYFKTTALISEMGSAKKNRIENMH